MELKSAICQDPLKYIFALVDEVRVEISNIDQQQVQKPFRGLGLHAGGNS
jgi:hypothetical protein